MRNAILAGSLYFLAVFAAGFVLGAARVIAVAPRVGEVAAALLELPLMLFASWLVCRRIVARLKVEPDMGIRAIMGGSAFLLLMGAESWLGLLAFGHPLTAQWAALATPAGAMGLLGQMIFAALPLLQALSARKQITPWWQRR